MAEARELIETAFERLLALSGFTEREGQQQLALLLADLMETGTTGCFEAPTGLGKSLAILIPAIATAMAQGKRIVVATYTNVLAEQYWNKDVPTALALFDDPKPTASFLIGRQRYACLEAIRRVAPQLQSSFVAHAKLGVESEFRQRSGIAPRDASRIWTQIVVPPVCEARVCPSYNRCFYFDARRKAERSNLVITNQSVVIQDALMASASEDSSGLLGSYDFLVIDEAHDFAQAASGGMEFSLNAALLRTAGNMATRLIEALGLREGANDPEPLVALLKGLERTEQSLRTFAESAPVGAMLAVSPQEIADAPGISDGLRRGKLPNIAEIGPAVADLIGAFLRAVPAMQRAKDAQKLPGMDADSERSDRAEIAKNCVAYLSEYRFACEHIAEPNGVEVTHITDGFDGMELRKDVVDLRGPLQELVWSKGAWACVSATLALDGSFEGFERLTGARPMFEEILPSPFDFSSQAALFMPPFGAVPDPTVARREDTEDAYFDAIARQLESILEAVGGRTLALFHSRREMEGVFERMRRRDDLPILLQRGSPASIGKRFKEETRASLFALRSFWTGFDAPGQTLSCVAIVRVPFEVPSDPPAVVRQAFLRTEGRDPFMEYTLAQAKMLIRQGAGRLIRSPEDRGLIAILDPRLQTKRYGPDILANLPPELRRFDDIWDAVAWIGLDGALPTQ